MKSFKRKIEFWLKMFFAVVVFTQFMPMQSTHAQNFKLFHPAFPSQFLKFKRSIYVYTPPVLIKQGNKFPVIYFHDGQNLFDPQRSVFGVTWELEKTLNRLIQNKMIPPVIVVGIDNTPDRIFEYTFSRDLQSPQTGGGANLYLDFITKELIPSIEKRFPASADKIMVGSSLGGLISLYAAITRPNIFSKVAALSPSIWWDERKILKLTLGASELTKVLYVDSGTVGGERPQDVMDLDYIIRNKFGGKIHFKSVIAQGSSHDEASWAKRLPNVLMFLFQANIHYSNRNNTRSRR